MKIKCNCCNKKNEVGALSSSDRKFICHDCLKFAPSHYGFLNGKELISHIKKKKEKKWWEFWK